MRSIRQPTSRDKTRLGVISVLVPARQQHILTGDHLPPLLKAEHIMGMPAYAERWTTARVRALIDEQRPWPRYELIDGALLVTPAPRIMHQRAVRELVLALANYFERGSLDAEVFMSPADLELEPGTIVQPDVFVLPPSRGNPVGAWPQVTSLLLAVEVLSPATARHDRVVKREFFVERVDVAEYWIVDLDARVIERWSHGADHAELMEQRLEWCPAEMPEAFTLDLPAFFARCWRTQDL